MDCLLFANPAETAHADGDVRLHRFAAALRRQLGAARAATAALRDGHGADPEWPLRVADDYLRALGFTLLAWGWAATARAVLQGGEGDPWLQGKLDAARFGVEWLLPEADALWQRVTARGAALPAIG